MKLRNLVATAALAGAMLAPTASMATSITPGTDLLLPVGPGNQISFAGYLDDVIGGLGYGAVSFVLDGTAGKTVGSAVSISAPCSLYNIQVNLFEDTDENDMWDVGTDLLIATGSPVTPLSSTVTAFNLVSGTKYFLGITGTARAAYAGEISAVPLPAAAWLFGSALLGFMGWSNRRKV